VMPLVAYAWELCASWCEKLDGDLYTKAIEAKQAGKAWCFWLVGCMCIYTSSFRLAPLLAGTETVRTSTVGINQIADVDRCPTNFAI
jgi:hypothetical protein